jgi:hypothetical protein
MPTSPFAEGHRVIVESTTMTSLTGYWGHVIKVGRYFDDRRGHFVVVHITGHRDGRDRLPGDIGFRSDNCITLFDRELVHID